MVSRVEKLVRKLTKQDQPIYGYQQYENVADIGLTAQLNTTKHITSLLSQKISRPLKILDLCCAQGFFAFHLAAEGYEVLGVDENKHNVELCNTLARENLKLNVQFIQLKIEDIFERISQNHFDLIIGMQGFGKHIINPSFIEQLKNLSEIALLKFSNSKKYKQRKTKNVPIYQTFISYPFCCEIENLATPTDTFVFLATQVLLLNNQLWKFETWKEESHALGNNTHQKSRRYYFRKNRMVKFFRFDGTRAIINKAELSRELDFLSANKKFPKIFQHQFGIHYGWIERELIIGENLLDILLSKEAFNTDAIIQSLLKKLVALEKNGLYHQDLRPWNIIVSKNNQVHLIDYGDISTTQTDVVYPNNIFFSFFITINNLITREVQPILPMRSAKISPNHLPKPYSDWLNEIWNTPINQWTFKLIYKKWSELSKSQVRCEPLAQELWNAKTEEYINTLRRYHDHEISGLTKQFNHLRNGYNDILKRIVALEKNT